MYVDFLGKYNYLTYLASSLLLKKTLSSLVRENCVYTLDDQRKFLGLFANSDESSPAQIESQLEDIAKQVSWIIP